METLIEVKSGKHLTEGTEMAFVEDGIPLFMPKRTAPPHPDLINAIALMDAHCANRTPYMTREGDIKRKKMKFDNPDTGKVETWMRPEFSDKKMGDDFHCTSFHVTDKGAVGMHFTVKQEGKAGTGINVKPISLVETDMFEQYEFTEDLQRVVKLVQKEFELYRGGKVDPRSTKESTGNENVPSVEKEATSITGVGGNADNDGETFEQIAARTAGTKGASAKKGKGGKQTADNPSGSTK